MEVVAKSPWWASEAVCEGVLPDTADGFLYWVYLNKKPQPRVKQMFDNINYFVKLMEPAGILTNYWRTYE